MIRKLLFLLEDFFGISRKQARSSVYLFAISIIALIVPSVYQRWIVPQFGSDLSAADQRRLDSITAKIEDHIKSIGEEAIDLSVRKDASLPSQMSDAPIRLFRFDPNSASTGQLLGLGIPVFLVRRIDNYRSKGGKFRKKEDLQRIYDFPADLFNRLSPYIAIEGQTVTANAASPGPSSFEASQGSRPEYKVKKNTTVVPFDVNTCDTAQLIKLKGIGPVLALRIVKFRDALGGFHSETQYPEIYGLDSAVVSELRTYAKVNSPHVKVNINRSEADDLLKHPYLRRERQFVRTLIQYRNQHGSFGGPDDLRKLKLRRDDLIEKITPYLDFQRD